MSTPDLTPLVRASREPERDARRYDFAAPRAISDRHVREMDTVHAAVAEELAAALGDALGEPVRAACGSVSEAQTQDFLSSRADPTVLCTAALDSGHAFVIDVPAPLAQFLVGRHLGGSDPIADTARDLSELERSIVEHDWMPTVIYAFAGGWAAPSPTVRGLGLSTAAQALGDPADPIVVVPLELELGSTTTRVELAYPARTLRALFGESIESADAARAPIDRLQVEVRAQLGTALVSVGDLARLSPGDVIPLDRAPDAPVSVHVGSRLRFDARAGTQSGRLALELLSPPTPIRTTP